MTKSEVTKRKRKSGRGIGCGMVPTNTEVGEFIRNRRLNLGLTQVELARRAGIVQRTVSQLEIGACKSIRDCRVDGLAKTLRCNPEKLANLMPERPDRVKTEIGGIVRSRRKELGLSCEEFAKKIGRSCSWVRHMEVRKWPYINYKVANELAGALNLEITAISRFIWAAKKTTISTLGELIRSRRVRLGIAMTDFARKVKVSKQYISQIEMGQCSLRREGDMVRRLANVLGLGVDELQVAMPTKKALGRLKQECSSS